MFSNSFFQFFPCIYLVNVSSKDLEMQWISLSLDRVRPILVINVYRPPQGNIAKSSQLILDSFERADIPDNAETYIMGDFNINYGDSKTRAFKELNFTMSSLGLRQLVKEPTGKHTMPWMTLTFYGNS